MKLIIIISLLFRVITPGEYHTDEFTCGENSPSDYSLVKAVKVAGEQFSSDPMGNVYVVKDNTLKKISKDHVQAAYYTNTFLGNIHHVDASDPFSILIFYKEYNQIVWVDNFLSEISSPIWLDDLGIDQVELVCSSSQGGFWVFNSLNNQLQYFNVNLKLVHESPSLNILTGPDVSPSFMIEKTRSLYLNVPGTGILVFDRFGNYSKTLPINVPSFFQVTDQFIYFIQDKELFSYNLQTAEMATFELPFSENRNSNKEDSGNGNPKGENPGSGNPESVPSGTIMMGAELQPGLLYIFTPSGYQVYRTN